MAPERPQEPSPRARVRILPGPIALGVLGFAFCAAFSVTTLTVGMGDWLSFALLAIGLTLLVVATFWGIARARTGERHVRWRGQ